MNYEDDLIREDLLEKIYSNPNKIFPWMNFTKNSKGDWVSKIHYNDRQMDSKGQYVSYIYKDNKYVIVDHARGNIDFISLYKNSNGISSIEAMDRLRVEYGLLPIRGDMIAYQKYYIQLHNMEKAQKKFVAALWGDTEEAKAARDYMTNVRKWSEEEIKKAGLGLITDAIKDTLWDKTPFGLTAIGKVYTLTIPFRVGIDIKGFKVRTVNPEIKDKYRSTKDLPKKSFLCGIERGMETITIVEGELDALRAKANGYTNIVATMGCGLSTKQAANAKKCGVRNVIFLLDNDHGGEFMLKIDENGRETGSIYEAEAQGLCVKVAELPKSVKNMDEFFNTWNADDLRKITNDAYPSCIYRCNFLFKKYEDIQNEQKGELTYRQCADLLKGYENLVLSVCPEDKVLLQETFTRNAEKLRIDMEGCLCLKKLTQLTLSSE